MAQFPGVPQGQELRFRQAGANLALQRLAAVRGIQQAKCVDLAHLRTHSRGHQSQCVHCVAGVDPCAQDRHTVVFGRAVDGLSQGRMTLERKQQLFGATDDARSRLYARSQLVRNLIQERAGRV